MEEDLIESVYYAFKSSNQYSKNKQQKQKVKKYKEICHVKLENNTNVYLNLNKNKNWRTKNSLQSKIFSKPEIGKEKQSVKEQEITIFKDGTVEEKVVFKFTKEPCKKRTDNLYFKKEVMKFHVKKSHDKNIRKTLKTRTKRKIILYEDFVVDYAKKTNENINSKNYILFNLKKFIKSLNSDGQFVLNTFEDPVCSIKQLPVEIPNENIISFRKMYSNYECEICYNNSDFKLVLSECQHGCCLECWKNYTKANFPNSEFKCCFKNCDTILKLDFLELLLPKEKFDRYENIYCAKIMREKNFIKCPKDCGNFFDKGCGFKFPKCVCGYSICMACELESHFPLTCDQFMFYLKYINEPGKHKYLVIKGKFCPKCKTFIEKNGGCPHMRCFCGYEFCWNCLETFSVSHNKCQTMDDFSMVFHQFHEKLSKDLIKMYNFKACLKNNLNVLLKLKSDFIVEFLSSEFYKKLKPEIMATLNLGNDNCQILVNQILDFSFDTVNKVLKIIEYIFAVIIYNKVQKTKIKKKLNQFQQKAILWLRILSKTSKNNHRDIFQKFVLFIPKIVTFLSFLD